MKKKILFFFIATFLFTGNLFCKDLDLNSFAEGLLKNVQFSSTNDKKLTEGSNSHSMPQQTELSIVFENHSFIYTKNNNNYILKFAYFYPAFINNTFEVNFSKYTIKDFEKIFSKSNIPSIESGFDTVGYSIKLKDRNLKLYFYFGKDVGGEFQFVRVEFY